MTKARILAQVVSAGNVLADGQIGLAELGLENVSNTPDSNKQVLSATKWTTARTLSFTGDATGSSNVDGSQSVATALTLANSGVTAGTYGSATNIPRIVVDAKGRVTTVTDVAVLIPSGSLTFIGDVSGSGNTGSSTALTLAAIGTSGTYTKITTDSKGRVTSGTTLTASDIPNLDASKITSGTLDASRLPSYVDDVLEYAALASFPATGETGKIYVDLTTNKTYRWSGSVYVYITSGAVDSVAGKTGVVTLVKADVGLGSVDNTADAAKNVLSATKLTTARTINGVSFDGSANITLTAAATNALTIGTGLSGTSYNGSTAVTVALATGYGDTQNPYASKTANYFLAAPNGAAGAPTFRALVAADIPTLNQNTTGTASNITAYTINQNLGTSNSPSFDQVLSTNNGNGTNFRVGDDAWIGDINTANTIRITGAQDATAGYIVFGNSNATALGRTGTGSLTYGGSAVILAGDTGTVTSTMIADGTIVNADISASAAIAVSKLAASTISGVTLGNNLNTLTMNVSGTGLSGSTTYNGSAAATFTVTSNATSANTASTIVARDASGNFSAGTITATLSGNATTATTASATPWSGITSKPTTISGYGITDGLTSATAASTYQTISGMSSYLTTATASSTYAPIGTTVTLTGSQTLTNKTFTGYTETIKANTGTVLDPTQGTIQYAVLSANTTYTESLADGQSLTLMINPQTYTVTWPTVTWIGSTASTAPTLVASVYNCITFFQFAGVLFGKYEGRV